MKRSTKRWLGAIVVLAIVAGLAYANFAYRKKTGKEVTVEAVQARDLTAIVSASGKIQAKRTVNISADNMGRVTQLSVEEGDRVKRGQFLMQIDPRNLASAVQSGEAGQLAARSMLEQQRLAIVSARENLALARAELKRQQELWAQQLTTRQELDRAENAVNVGEAELRQREVDIKTQDQRIRQEGATLNQAQYNLSRARIESPIDGIVSRRNIEEGETVVIGTMNNAGTVLLTIADMSIIEAEVEVDETDIPTVRLGQVAKVTIDALPGKEYTGKVTEIGNSPIQAATGQAASAGQAATNFKVTVQLDQTIDEVRPGFTCSAEIETAKRAQGRGRADSGDGRPRPGLRQGRHHRPAAEAGRQEEEGPDTGDAGRTARGADPEGNRGRVRDARQERRVRAGAHGHRGRALLRGHVGREGR